MSETIREGMRLGLLTVAGKTDKRKNGYTVWLCKCDCGGEILLDTRALQRGKITDCGCKSNVRPGQNDLTNRRFGKLLCLEPTDERGDNGAVMWKCRCDCGNICLIPSTQLTKGCRKSCGCLKNTDRESLIGHRFGKLTVTEYAGKERGMHRWKCKCDCGGEAVVGQSLLKNGKTKSCGCLKESTRLSNLKLSEGTSVSLLEAGKRRKIKSNTSGYTGVYKNKKLGKWVAQITFKGKTYYLGSYKTLEEAVKARIKGEELHEKFLIDYYRQKGE